MRFHNKSFTYYVPYSLIHNIHLYHFAFGSRYTFHTFTYDLARDYLHTRIIHMYPSPLAAFIATPSFKVHKVFPLYITA
nr:MAG TPA: hypothetical protein [Bacteriophage sp.]